MAMNKQRRTSNILNIVSYDTSGNVTLPAGLTVSGLASAGFVKTNASGVMSIDPSTYLTTAADWFGAVTTGGTLDFNHVTNTRPGTGYTLLLGNATNGPGNGGIYYHTLNFEYSSKNGTGNISQLAIAYGSPGNDIKMRGRYDSVWTSWVTFLNSGNYNSYSPTLTGGGASGTWGISITGNAGSASTLAGSQQGLTYQPGDGYVAYTYAHLTTTPGIFPLSDNANSILTVSRHPGNYYSQLGFSSNGNIYYRNFVNTAIDTSQAWKTILDTGNSPFAANMNQNVRTSDNVSFQGISQNDIVGRPYAAWGATSATGAVIIKFPGTGANYGMIHAVIDIYEYNSNNVCTVIVGGHNWSNQWYSYGANSVGFTDKQVRVAFKDGQYCIVIGDSTSTWSYAQVVLRKISNGVFYQGSMNVTVGYTAAIGTDTYTWVSEDLRGLRVPNSISVSGNTVLHAANYNSYAPSLTGAGASGTWGISITGNAGSATVLNSSHYIQKTGTSNNYNTDFTNTPAGTYRYLGDDSGITNNPGGSWWFVENFRHTNSSNIWGTQVAWGWEDNANRLATRNIQAGTFGSWVYYLNSSNFNTYAPTLTGGGASGTWGISISGNAANANTLDNIDSTGFGRAYSAGYGFHGSNSAISTATFISILNSQGAFNQPYWVARGSWCYACNGYITDTGVGTIHLAGCTVEVIGDATNFTIRIHTPTTSSSGVINREFIYVQNSSGYSPGWRVLLSNYNYNDYAPTLTGGGASGTWGINITGNAATVGGYAVSTGVGANTVVVREASGYIFANYINSNVSEAENPAINTFFVSNGDGYLRKATVAHVRSALGESDTLATVMSRGSTSSTYLSLSGGGLFSGSNNVKFRNEKGSGVYLGSTNNAQLQAYSEDGGAAFMSFHRVNAYAVNMGLDPDNVFRIGGWSASADRLVLDMSGNLSVPGLMSNAQSYTGGWFRNNTNNTGLYNENTTMHWSSKDNGYWDASSTTTVSSIRFFTGSHIGTLRGYIFANSSGELGFLDSAANWILRCVGTSNTYLTGTFTASGDVVAYSDARIKTNVQTIDNALDKVISMRGVTYNRTDVDDTSEKVGVIAQEIQEVLPQVVTKDDAGMLGVSYGNLAGVFIEAFKEQQRQIEDLKKQIEFLANNQ
jgi:hypothetical protein